MSTAARTQSIGTVQISGRTVERIGQFTDGGVSRFATLLNPGDGLPLDPGARCELFLGQCSKSAKAG